MAWQNNYPERSTREAYEDRLWWSEFHELNEKGLPATAHINTLPVLTDPEE
jgi:hypothetical protein